MTPELTTALARLREGTEVLRTGGGATLTARQCHAVLDEIDRLEGLAEEHEPWTPQEGDTGYHCSDDSCRMAPHYVKSDDGAWTFRDGRWSL